MKISTYIGDGTKFVERTNYGELAGFTQQKDSTASQRLFFIALRSYSSSAYSVQHSVMH